MRKINSFFNRYAALTYFILTFIFTWGSIFLIVGSVGFPISREQIESAGPMVYAGMLIGPALAGILMIGLVEGRAGFRSLFSRLGKWRVGVRWYVLALCATPLLVIAILFLLSLTDPEFRPAILVTEDKVSLIISGVMMGLVVGFFEELGWTGFVIPRLRQRYGVLATGLIVGLIWGAWHYPPFSASASDAEGLPPFVYISILLFSFLPAYRVILVWIYDRTQSMLLTILMHAPLSACQLVLIPATLSGSKLVTYDLIFGLVLWILAVVILILKPGTISSPVVDSQTI